MKRFLIAALLLLALPVSAWAQATLEPIQVGSSTAVFSSRSQTKLIGLTITTSGNAVSVGVVDSASALSAGAVSPKACFYIAANQTAVVSFPTSPIFSAGIAGFVSSTGCGLYTADTTAHVSAEVAR